MLIICLISISQVHWFTTVAQYSFHGLSAGITQVQCEIDPPNNPVWNFPGKLEAIIAFYRHGIVQTNQRSNGDEDYTQQVSIGFNLLEVFGSSE